MIFTFYHFFPFPDLFKILNPFLGAHIFHMMHITVHRTPAGSLPVVSSMEHYVRVGGIHTLYLEHSFNKQKV